MTSIRTTICALSCFFILTGSAFADNIIDYTLTAGTDEITFSLPQLPAVQTTCTFDDSFCISPVALVVDGTPIANGTVAFYTPGNEGGLTIQEGSTLLVNNDGPGAEQLFTGPLANPTLETFSNLQLIETGFASPTLNEAFTLNATSSAAAAAPEPGSYATLILGLGGLMLLARQRRSDLQTR
jgi:hypothetical protein